MASQKNVPPPWHRQLHCVCVQYRPGVAVDPQGRLPHDPMAGAGTIEASPTEILDGLCHCPRHRERKGMIRMIGAWTRRLLRPVLGGPDASLQRMIFRAYRRALPISLEQGLENPVLPPGYARRLPERVVELLLARLSYAPGKKVLDVGHAYIMECHRKLLASLPEPRHLTGVDIAEPTYDTRPLYERSLKSDITGTKLPDNSFDLIWCVSTLEHLGMDNSGYTASFATGSHMAAQAIREMVRLAGPGGHVLISVPFGKFEDHGWFINLDWERWQSLL
ncbi:class I SAM-dependent methyltransferase, partial [bacterium]